MPINLAENLSLPGRWKRLPKALTGDEISRLLAPQIPETPASLCDQAILELAYASGLRLAELRNARLEQLFAFRIFVEGAERGDFEINTFGTKAARRIFLLRRQTALALVLQESHEMGELHLPPIRQLLRFRPRHKLFEERRIRALRVFRVAALVAQVLEKIFHEVLHHASTGVSREARFTLLGQRHSTAND